MALPLGLSFVGSYPWFSWGQCYKTFYGRNLRIFVTSKSVCPWQAFSAYYNKQSSLVWKSVNYSRKSFITLGPGHSCIRWQRQIHRRGTLVVINCQRMFKRLVSGRKYFEGVHSGKKKQLEFTGCFGSHLNGCSLYLKIYRDVWPIKKLGCQLKSVVNFIQ